MPHEDLLRKPSGNVTIVIPPAPQTDLTPVLMMLLSKLLSEDKEKVQEVKTQFSPFVG